jgi:thioredoxin-related protein
MKKRFIFFIMLLPCLFAAAQEQEVLQHFASWNEVLAKARQSNKLIFIDVYFTGCHPCAVMDKEVFTNKLIKEKLEAHFIGVKTDILKEPLGDSILRKYQTMGFPTFLVLSKEGALIDATNGFADVGVLMAFLNNADSLDKHKTYLNGFAPNLDVPYAPAYLDYFGKERKRVDDTIANRWIIENRKLYKEAADMLFMITRNPASGLKEDFINNYNAYRALYGQALVLGKATAILSANLKEKVTGRNDQLFSGFLKTYQNKFPAADWKIIRLLLADHYYNTIVKDADAFLSFAAANPVLYKNYYGAMVSNLTNKQQLSPEKLLLLGKWGADAIDEHTAFETILTIARVYQQQNKPEVYKSYVQLAIDKARKYEVDTKAYEAMLTN